MRIMFRLILPNVSIFIFVLATIEFVRAIIRESFMSFLEPRRPPDRSLMGRHARGIQGLHAGHVVACRFSGACHFLFRLGVNLMGDGLRDLLDPRIRSKA